MEHPDIAPNGPRSIHSVIGDDLQTRRAYIYYGARLFFTRSSRAGWEVFGLNAGDLNNETGDRTALVQSIADDTGFSYSGVDSRLGEIPGSFIETYHLLKDRDYTLGELAALADQLLQQYKNDFVVVTVWGNTGYGHDQGFGGTL
jgi:hypothetical protein